ncbi:MAG: lysostaphin resistance A-like protein [Muribaculaceae bacterium]
MNTNNRQIKLSFTLKLLFLFSCFLVCLYLTTVISSLLMSCYGNNNSVICIEITLQNILSFALPSVALAFFCYKAPFTQLMLHKAPQWRAIVYVVIFYVASLPLLNFLCEANAAVTFPKSLQDLELVLRQYEDAANAITNQLLEGNTIVDVMILVLIIGGLTGFGEELFFRGGLTRLMLEKPLNKHLAVWIGGVVFSFLHFQFFGFVPRMLMGVFFGYLMVWTGNLWIPIIAHALNNATVVVSHYLVEQRLIGISPDKIGTFDQMPWLTVISVILVIVLVWKHSYWLKKQ